MNRQTPATPYKDDLFYNYLHCSLPEMIADGKEIVCQCQRRIHIVLESSERKVIQKFEKLKLMK